MNHFEIKIKRILELLLDSDKYVTLDFLSQQTGISKRSTQNYMDRIERWLAEKGLDEIRLLKKQGYGIKLFVEGKDRQRLEDILNTEKYSIFDDVVSRRLEILKALIFSNDELTIQFLADQFYISRSVILKDLEWVSQWLSGFNLKLFKTQRRGIGIVGSEISRRNAIAGFFDIYKSKEITRIKDVNSSGRLTEEIFLKLKCVYPRIDIAPICTIIEDTEKKFDFFLTDDYFITLVTHLVISVARLSSGKNVDECFLPPEAEYGGLERKAAEYVATRIETEYGHAFPECERIYICIHLMSYNTFNYIAKSNSNDNLKNIPQKIERLAISLIDCVDAQLGTSFATDKILFFGIIFHLKTSRYRLEEKTSLVTVSRDELSNVNKEIYNAVKKAGNLFEDICGVKPNDEEFIAIAMHFGLSAQRGTKRIKALLICNSGISAGITLCRHLAEGSPDLDIVDVCSSFQLAYKAENEYDVILSTEPLKGASKPVCDLSRISRNEYLKYLEDFIFSLS